MINNKPKSKIYAIIRRISLFVVIAGPIESACPASIAKQAFTFGGKGPCKGNKILLSFWDNITQNSENSIKAEYIILVAKLKY